MKHLTRAFDRQNEWWKYLVVIVVALFVGQLVGAIPLAVAIGIAIARKGGELVAPENMMDFEAYGLDPNLGLVLLVIPFIVTLILAIVLAKAFHYRTFNDIVNGGRKFRWNRFWTGVGVWGVIMLGLFIIQLILFPNELELQYNPRLFYTLIVVAVVFIPIQSGAEEFLFRGYLAQGVAGWTRNRLAVIVITSLVFALVHSMNPEVKEHGFWVMIPQYFTFGLTFAIMAVLDDGIELAIGTHAVNNCLGAILVTNKDSVFQTPSLFFQTETDPASEFIVLLVSSVVMLVVYKLVFKWDFKMLTKKIETEEEFKVEGVAVFD